MYALRIIFIFLCLGALGCMVQGLRLKRRNIGYLITTAIITISDAMCIVLVAVRNAKEASKILLPYYIVHAWLLFGILLMVIYIDRFRRFIVPVIISAIFCLYQTYLVITQYRGARVFTFQKRIYFRKAWWIATDSKNTGLLNSFHSYRIAGYISLTLIFILLFVCVYYSHKIFRMKYISHILIMIGYTVLDFMTVHYQFPVWIPCIVYNLVAVLCLYYTGIYANSRLREWSLDSFANDMSDGLILYDRYDDLIHLNDMIHTTLEEALVLEFKDRNKLDGWIAETEDPDNENVIKYINNDKVYYFKVTIRNLGGDNSRIGTLYILHDTTDSMKTIIAMKEANDELERASRMKSDFLANMSHEIRTPMNAVIGMAEIAMREKNPAQITDYLLQIQSSGRNLLNIINDILDYSKIESGKMEIIEDEYDTMVELEDIANVLATRIGNKPLEMFVFVKGMLPRRLYADSMRIRQVLINLANNAIKFTNEGMVKIVITGEHLKDDIEKVTFHVIDTGIGIREEDLKKLFVSFQQVDSRRNRSAEGTGLGLAISQKLVEAMHGEIGVTSEYGVGSDFWFSLPIRAVDMTNDLEVADRSNKHAFALSQTEVVLQMFRDDMENLGVTADTISSLDDYVPSGKQDYIFFEEESYEQMAEYLGKHPEITGVVFGKFGSEFENNLPDNIHLLSRPATTMRLANILNGHYDDIRKIDEDKLFKIDFIAPDAHILVVDDNDINLTIAEGLLSPLQVQLDKAGGGQEAIDKAQANDYDIILMDHMMPEIDGVDATKAIRSTHPDHKHPVIIALSANAMQDARSLFTDAGMDDFVAKPIDVKDLTKAIRKWLPEEKIQVLDEEAAKQAAEAASSDKPCIDINYLDLDNAVQALGSPALYDKIAGEYYRSGEDKLNGIIEAYNNKDWPDYTIRVHALKSSSRQIGAMELGSMAEALEKAGKADDIEKIMTDTEATLDAFRKLLNDMAPYYGEDNTDNSDKPMITDDKLAELLDKLEKACDELDMDEMDSVSSALKEYNYNDDVHELIDSLHKAIGNIDTEECMNIVSKLRG